MPVAAVPPRKAARTNPSSELSKPAPVLEERSPAAKVAAVVGVMEHRHAEHRTLESRPKGRGSTSANPAADGSSKSAAAGEATVPTGVVETPSLPLPIASFTI
jgi:hypothetical protein